jgi:hypothetical protein
VKSRSLAVICLASLYTAACGSNPTSPTPLPTPTAASKSVITATISPNPVVGVANPSTSQGAFPFLASFTITVTETAGLACNLNRLQLRVPPNPNAFELPVAEISKAAGTNFIGARGTLAIPLTLSYKTPTGTKALHTAVTVEAIDGNSNVVTTIVEFDTV